MNLVTSRAQSLSALILAAGVSRRLYPLTQDQPKCLLEIGGRAIIDHQVEALVSSGIADIHVVVGYYREKLQAHLSAAHPSARFTFHINHHFFETNTASSMHLALAHIPEGPLVLMNGDVLYSQELLQRLLTAPAEAVFAVEVKRCGEEEVKVVTGEAGRIAAIGKHLIPAQCLGEFIGVASISGAFKMRLERSLNALIEAGGKNDYFESAIDPILAETEAVACDITGLPCIEIDFIEDYERARHLLS